MLSSQRFKPLLLHHLKGIPFQTPKVNPFVSTLSLKHSTTTTSDQNQFTLSYLTTNCGFSPEIARKTSKQVRFDSAEKPDSVIACFRNHGFSDSDIRSILRNAPNVLACDPNKRILPKFEFLRSKGASSSDIVQIVSRSPRILYSSLEKSIIPTYELLRRFLQSDAKIIDRILTCRYVFGNDLVVRNVGLLLDDGVTDSNITYLLGRRPSILMSYDMRRALDEVKDMGFDPSKITFGVALLAKRAISKSQWDSKVDEFKRWGWSEEMVLDAFRRRPFCMLVSKDKISEVMRFWVNQMGWNSFDLVKRPEIFSYSLEKRVIPRAFVVHYLISKGLRKNNVYELSTPFAVTEKLFLEKYVKCFKEERYQLLKLYQEKMSVQKKGRMVAIN
ncbi:Transcription termination factor, mitochondrial/chloroplastic [Sesbania bispinosa]|nr:Transcription termination factor, mitochondrial/chloroplastic [Sesbania bispinosa]